MPQCPMVVLAPLEFYDLDLVGLTVALHPGLDLTTFYIRRADCDVRAFANGEHPVELDRATLFGIELFDAQRAPRGHAILLATGLENGIHT